jgi:hypothetical protein
LYDRGTCVDEAGEAELGIDVFVAVVDSRVSGAGEFVTSLERAVEVNE